MEGPGVCVCVCVRTHVQNSHALSKCTLPSTSVCSPTWKLSCSSFDVLISGSPPCPRGQGGGAETSCLLITISLVILMSSLHPEPI